ncbi:glycosyltransferase family 2 protein [Cryomorpha ignava]|nr:glycosyltransferase family 2 protein [Cryomorpha ignava]
MNTLPKISIVTPSFNQGQYLEQTIDSVLSQDYPNLEYFIVDGGSTDNSKEIIEKYAKHLTWWVSEKDNGQSHAINKGLSRATGEIINWINSDDYYEPDALKTVAKAFENPKITMATFRANVFGLQNRRSRGTDLYQDNLPKAIAYSRIDQPETFFRKSAIDHIGLLNEDLHYCMDKEWLMRYFLFFGNQRTMSIDSTILNFRYHEDSKSTLHQTKFEQEADRIYLSLATKHNYEPAVNAIKAINQNSLAELEFTLKFTNNETIHYALNYYLFKRYCEKYEALEWSACSKLAKQINLYWLARIDRSFLVKLERKRKLLPTSIIKLLRKGRR